MRSICWFLLVLMLLTKFVLFHSSQAEKAVLPKLALRCVHSLFGLTEDTLPLTAFVGCMLQACVNFPHDNEPARNGSSSVLVFSLTHTFSTQAVDKSLNLRLNHELKVKWWNPDCLHLFSFQWLCALSSFKVQCDSFRYSSQQKTNAALHFPFVVPAVILVRQQPTYHLLWYPLSKQ